MLTWRPIWTPLPLFIADNNCFALLSFATTLYRNILGFQGGFFLLLCPFISAGLDV